MATTLRHHLVVYVANFQPKASTWTSVVLTVTTTVRADHFSSAFFLGYFRNLAWNGAPVHGNLVPELVREPGDAWHVCNSIMYTAVPDASTWDLLVRDEVEIL